MALWVPALAFFEAFAVALLFFLYAIVCLPLPCAMAAHRQEVGASFATHIRIWSAIISCHCQTGIQK